MRILHVCHHFYPCVGGLETHLLDLCLNLKKAGYTSDVYCLDRCAHSKKKLKPVETHKGIKIMRSPFKDMKYYKTTLPKQILKTVKKYDIINVHVMGFFSDLLLLTRRIHKKPVVLTTHGGFFHTKNAKNIKALYLKWVRKIFRKADRIIATGKVDYKIFSDLPNVELVPDVIETGKYLKIKRNPVRNNFLHVGRIAKNKRVDLLLDVISELKKITPDTRLYIIGEDMEGIRVTLEKRIKRMGMESNVLFLGRTDDKKKIEMLGKCEFFLSSSEYESFGISLLEAMASGIPVIGNDIEAYRNLIENGKNGYIADFSKPEEVAELILELKNKDLSGIAKKARETSKQYDWSHTIDKIVKIYKSCL